MSEPLFKMGQRVYNRANPYHGKIIDIYKEGGGWSYTLALDLPNPSNEARVNYGEDGLRATLEETIAWREAEKKSMRWACGSCFSANEGGLKACQICGMPYSESFPDAE